jgi:hypothetical protein
MTSEFMHGMAQILIIVLAITIGFICGADYQKKSAEQKAALPSVCPCSCVELDNARHALDICLHGLE